MACRLLELARQIADRNALGVCQLLDAEAFSVARLNGCEHVGHIGIAIGIVHRPVHERRQMGIIPVIRLLPLRKSAEHARELYFIHGLQ